MFSNEDLATALGKLLHAQLTISIVATLSASSRGEGVAPELKRTAAETATETLLRVIDLGRRDETEGVIAALLAIRASVAAQVFPESDGEMFGSR